MNLLLKVYLFVHLQLLISRDLFCDSSDVAENNTNTNTNTMWNNTHLDELRTALLKDYQTINRPTKNGEATVCHLHISIRHIKVKEEESTVTLHTLITLNWHDERLKWNPDDYGGIQHITSPFYKHWYPDLYIYNSASEPQQIWGYEPSFIEHTGEVKIIFSVMLSVVCDLDLTYWPYDDHNCHFKLGSWTKTGAEVDLQLYRNASEASLEQLITTNNHWEIYDTHVTKSIIKWDDDDTRAEINLYVRFYRSSPSFRDLIFVPKFAVVVLTLLVFWLPPQGSAKIILNCINGVIISFFMMYFISKLPNIGSNTPLIMSFYSCTFVLSTIAMIEIVIVKHLVKPKNTSPVPGAIRNFLENTKFGVFFGYASTSTTPIEANTNHRDHDDCSIIEEQRFSFSETYPTKDLVKTHQEEWSKLVAAIDLFFFIVFCFIFGILCISH